MRQSECFCDIAAHLLVVGQRGLVRPRRVELHRIVVRRPGLHEHLAAELAAEALQKARRDLPRHDVEEHDVTRTNRLLMRASLNALTYRVRNSSSSTKLIRKLDESKVFTSH